MAFSFQPDISRLMKKQQPKFALERSSIEMDTLVWFTIRDSFVFSFAARHRFVLSTVNLLYISFEVPDILPSLVASMIFLPISS